MIRATEYSNQNEVTFSKVLYRTTSYAVRSPVVALCRGETRDVSPLLFPLPQAVRPSYNPFVLSAVEGQRLDSGQTVGLIGECWEWGGLLPPLSTRPNMPPSPKGSAADAQGQTRVRGFGETQPPGSCRGARPSCESGLGVRCLIRPAFSIHGLQSVRPLVEF